MLVVSGGLVGCIGDDDEPDDNDDPEDELEAHLSDANDYDGTSEDLTGQEEVEVGVGDPEGGSNYKFDPPLFEIDEGTTVVWEWVDDVNHSVTHTDGDDFDSGIETDHIFEHTFEEAGTYLYHCQPHRAQGHLGALVVG